MALMAADDGVLHMHARWMLSEFADLADPFVRAAVIRYVAATTPDEVLDAPAMLGAIVVALNLLAGAGEPLPDPQDATGAGADPAWRAALTVIHGAFAEHAGRPVDSDGVRAAWSALTGEHRNVLASLFSNLRSVDYWAEFDTRPGSVPVQGLLAAAMPAGGVDVLVWSLDHPDQQRALLMVDHGRDRAVIELLATVGGRAAAEALRAFAGHRELGEAAMAAARAIEARTAIRRIKS
jgi:hypothetical protein